MVDPKVQERFARRCTDAAFGYGTATTAAYAAFAGQVLDFWANVLSPDSKPKPSIPSWPMPGFVPGFGQAFGQGFGQGFGWPPPRNEAAAAFGPFFWPTAAPSRAMPFAPFAFAPGLNPFQAWFSAFPFASAPAAWPMAFMMIAYGMPSSVAWPTAEANAAAIDAADAAAVSVRQAFASYRTDGGHTGQQHWPVAQLFMLTALLPMSLGAMLAQVRVP